MKYSVPYKIYLAHESAKIFNNKENFIACSDELKTLKGIRFNYYINSCEGHEYFEHAPDFYARIKELRQSGVKLVPFLRDNPNDAYISLNDYNKRKKQ